MLNRWQFFWKSLDEARVIVRLMVVVKLAGLFAYIFLVSSAFFDIVRTAMDKDLDLANVIGVLGAVTTFAGLTIPILANMYKDVWKDYRQSGTDWQMLSRETWDDRH